MARYFKIHLTGTDAEDAPISIWLTSNGDEGGKPCRVTIPEAALLLAKHSANTTVASDGTPRNEIPHVSGKGRPFTIEMAWCATSVWEDLKEFIDNCVDIGHTIRVATTEGEPGDIDVESIPMFKPDPYTWTDMRTGYIRGLKLFLITSEVHV